MRNRSPAKSLFHPFAPCLPKCATLFWIVQQQPKPRSQIACIQVRMCWKACDRILIEGHEISRFSVDYNFFDAAGRAGNNRRLAGHRFEINDAKWLIYRRATEYPSIAVQLDRFRLSQHLLNPNDARMIASRGRNL